MEAGASNALRQAAATLDGLVFLALTPIGRVVHRRAFGLVRIAGITAHSTPAGHQQRSGFERLFEGPAKPMKMFRELWRV